VDRRLIALGKSKEPLTADQIAARFLNARRANVEEILETLCAMGQAHQSKSKGAYLP
jgi:predicted transcriptional regulator